MTGMPDLGCNQIDPLRRLIGGAEATRPPANNMPERMTFKRESFIERVSAGSYSPGTN